MIKNEFSSIYFNDKRLEKRWEKIISSLTNNFSLSFTEIFNAFKEIKAFYRFISNKKITFKKLLNEHIKRTKERCEKEDEILVVSDTTSYNFKAAEKIKGLGYIDTHKEKKGFLSHNCFAISGRTGESLGLLHMETIVRKTIYPKDEEYYERQKRKKESEKWIKSAKEIDKMFEKDKKIIIISDRESDIYNYMELLLEMERDFIIRACQNRLTENGHLFDEITGRDKKGVIKINILEGKRERVKRFRIYSKEVILKSPKKLGEKKRIKVNYVYAETIDKKIRLKLLTSEKIETLEDCKRVVEYYKFRWKIEELHKGIKTGCQIEKRQFGRRERLEKILVIFSVIAWYGLYLRDKITKRIRSNEILDKYEIKILKAKYPWLKMEGKNIIIGIAMLGGYLNRRGDKKPGWQTILRGIMTLKTIKEGLLLYEKIF